MIRTSTAIATAAICLSLVVHFLGLSVTFRAPPEASDGTAPTEVVAMGNAFEDIVGTVTEPVPPQPAPVPEPPPEAVPEPERAETPTSRALVASDNPQNVATPDTGSTQTVRPGTTGLSMSASNAATQPTTPEPSGGTETTVSDARMTPPVASDPASDPPTGTPEGRPVPVEAVPAAPASTPSAAPERLAALPAPAAAPVPPVAPAPSTVPVTPPERAAIEPDTPENLVEPQPETPESAEPEDDTGGSDLAVASSLRPQMPTQRPAPVPEGTSDGAARLSDTRLAPSQLMESPLMAYQRDGTNMFNGRSGGSQSGGSGAEGSRGPGNSNVTNYAGQVLTHLNRVQPVAVAARGWARVFFEINPDGTLAWVDIIDGSGSQEINRAAKEQVRSAAPFPRPPAGENRKLNFVYQIQ
jgi:TonB family protein